MPNAQEKLQEVLSLDKRGALTKLPMEERRMILAKQAEELASDYEQDTERIDLQGGDLLEYE